jgi:tetratricopeptide (TPR) repeat protein
MLYQRYVFILLILSLTALSPAQQPATGTPSQDGLGVIHFPNSCKPASQTVLLRGILQVHSFQYAAAEKAFTEILPNDPACAMAYWGLALANYHPLWEGANGQALTRGHEYLEKIKKDWPITQREREYVDALSIIFRDTRRLTDERIADYSRALAAIHKHYPDDGEAIAFYALSRLALAQGDDDPIRNEVIAMLNDLSAREPQHPGAVHYLIHAADTPGLAAKGLEAARRYAKIAPDSSHALHMPSHIFVRVGLWQESVDSNYAAAVAAEGATKQHMGEAHYQFHALDFLNHSYLQMGEEAKARQVIEELNKVHGRSATETTNMKVTLTTRTLLELHRWQEAMVLEPEGDSRDQQMIYLVRTIAAARTGDAKTAEWNYKKLKDALKNDRHKDGRMEDYRRHTAEAWVDFAKGKHDAAIKKIRSAADKQDREDPGAFGVSAREMMADMLMESHQPAQALAAYEAVLALGPNRFNALYGAAAAAEMEGDAGKAKTYFSKLREICPPQADREELHKVKVAVAGAN